MADGRDNTSACLAAARKPGRGEANAGRPLGMMLVEMLLAIAVFVVIGASMSILMLSASAATGNQVLLRELWASDTRADVYLSGAIRASKMVLVAGDNYLVLWLAETKPDGIVSLSELCRVERDSATGELYGYRAPVGLPADQDTEYDLDTTDFRAATDAVKGTAVFPRLLVALGVTGFSVTPDRASARDAAFVGYEVVLAGEGVSYTAIGGAALRGR